MKPKVILTGLTIAFASAACALNAATPNPSSPPPAEHQTAKSDLKARVSEATKDVKWDYENTPRSFSLYCLTYTTLKECGLVRVRRTVRGSFEKEQLKLEYSEQQEADFSDRYANSGTTISQNDWVGVAPASMRDSVRNFVYYIVSDPVVSRAPAETKTEEGTGETTAGRQEPPAPNPTMSATVIGLTAHVVNLDSNQTIAEVSEFVDGIADLSRHDPDHFFETPERARAFAVREVSQSQWERENARRHDDRLDQDRIRERVEEQRHQEEQLERRRADQLAELRRAEQRRADELAEKRKAEEQKSKATPEPH